MKNIIALLFFAAAFIAVIYTGMWYVEEQNKQYINDQKRGLNVAPDIIPDEDTDIAGSDPFGLFGADEVMYEVSVKVKWNARNHSGFYPSSANIAQPVLWTGKTNPVFTVGSQASAGLIEYAETGRIRELKKEMEKLLRDSVIDQYDIKNRIDAPGEDTYTITVSRDNPVVSIIGGLQPSSDWFVALEGLNMLEDNRWKNGVRVSALALDAGTKQGDLFESSSKDTNPQGRIGPLQNASARALAPFVEFEFKQLGL